MKFALEGIKRDLAHHGVDHVLDLGGQQDLALGGIGRLFQQRLKRQHLAKNACRFRQSQRRGRHQRPLFRRQHLMHPVAQLMRKCHYVPRLAQVIEQHIRVRRRHCGVRESSR